MKSKSSFSFNQTVKALFALVLVFTMFMTPIKADERRDAEIKLAQEMLNVVSEQVSRHMYDAALATISSIDSSEDFALSEKQAGQLEEYRSMAGEGAQAQEMAVKALEQIDEYIEQEDYSSASDSVEAIKANKKYLSSDITKGLKEAELSVSVLGQNLKKRAKNQFNKSKKFYNSGDLEQARIGFEAVVNSGVDLSFFDRGGDFGTADTYLAKISEKQAAIIAGEPVEELDTDPIMEVEDEEVAIIEEPAAEDDKSDLFAAAEPKKKSKGFWIFGNGTKAQ